MLKILIAVVMGVATHLPAPPHRVFSGSHAHAVQSDRRKSDGQYRDHTPRNTCWQE